MTEQRTNEEWLRQLQSSGALQEAAIADLRDLLLRAALYFFSRTPGDLAGLSRDDVLHRAEDCAQDALISLMAHLSDFRGDSKFSTWAYKFAINTALVTARHERLKGVSLDQLAESGQTAFANWAVDDSPDGVAPEQSAVQGEIRAVIQDVIDHDLTDRQRTVLSMMVFDEIPMDEVVRYLGANRNAVYKLLHDARRKLRDGLQSRGFEVAETLALFGAPR